MTEGVGQDGADPGLITVQLLDLPVALHARATEHGEELQREFVLIAEQVRHAEDPPSLPRRLLDLIAALQHRYSAFTVEQEDVLDRAVAEGQRSLDLTFRVPADVADAAVALGGMLDEADEYCREGQHLLTLATPPDLVAYRRWYLQEFVDQIAGSPPTPWSPGWPANVEPLGSREGRV